MNKSYPSIEFDENSVTRSPRIHIGSKTKSDSTGSDRARSQLEPKPTDVRASSMQQLLAIRTMHSQPAGTAAAAGAPIRP